ncbi:MAG: hypothetical protein LQ342_005310 [Letrouitia transgressa]|nr:MAG: hypothetical protein LQ342_005310 [Letrouitia transgressa]
MKEPKNPLIVTSAHPSSKDRVASYILNESRQDEIVGCISVLIALATIAIILRFVARYISKSKFWVDDMLILGALVVAYGLNGLNINSAINNGWGRHAITLTPYQLIAFAKANIATQLLFSTSITLTKLSLLTFYHRIFPIRTFTRLSSAIGILQILWLIALILGVFLQCRPLAYFWNRGLEGKCINENSFSYGMSAANVVTDLLVLGLPVPWLWGLQLGRGKRVGLVGVFALGGFVCVSAIVRIPLLTALKETDTTWTIVNAGIWINVECNLGVVSACLPVMRPLVKVFPALFRFRPSAIEPPSSYGYEKRDGKSVPLSGESTWTGSGSTSTKVGTYRGSMEGYEREDKPGATTDWERREGQRGCVGLENGARVEIGRENSPGRREATMVRGCDRRERTWYAIATRGLWTRDEDREKPLPVLTVGELDMERRARLWSQGNRF